ncbi:MAG: hypothetical protein QXT47_06100 [Desulfurococcaceae archaeon]
MGAHSDVAGVGFLILVLSAFFPWLTITLFNVQYNINLIDIYLEKIQSSLSRRFFLIQSYIQYITNTRTTLITILLYPFIIIVALAGIGDRGASFGSGILAIILAYIWISDINSIRNILILFPSSIFGITFFDISVGLGPYIAIIGGVLLLIASLIPEEKPLIQEKEPLKSNLDSQESTPK